jgi:hypothetical protein
MAQLSMQTTCCMRSQIHIKNFADALDWTQVEQVLVSATKRFGMVDTTVTSRVPQTIFCCAQKVGHGFGIGGRVHGDLGIVDFYPGKQPSEHFLPIVESIASELRRIFGERYFVPKPSEFIEPQHTLPVSQASREFTIKHFRSSKG